MSKNILTIFVGVVVTFIQMTDAFADVKDPDEIIRSLAPIQYLPEHSGKSPVSSIDLTIPFMLNSAKLVSNARPQLKALGEALASPDLREKVIEIAGHTDASGAAEYNRRLSTHRATAVKNYLVRMFGFDERRFQCVGHGEDKLKDPLFPNAPNNRRVEITVIADNVDTQKKSTNSDNNPLDADGKIKW